VYNIRVVQDAHLGEADVNMLDTSGSHDAIATCDLFSELHHTGISAARTRNPGVLGKPNAHDAIANSELHRTGTSAARNRTPGAYDTGGAGHHAIYESPPLPSLRWRNAW
jgi:hypothetical protein